MSAKDSFAYGDAQKHLQTTNQNSKNKNCTTAVVENAGHTFGGKEQELADIIYEFVK